MANWFGAKREGVERPLCGRPKTRPLRIRIIIHRFGHLPFYTSISMIFAVYRLAITLGMTTVKNERAFSKM
jgi:hypothetical protein